MILNYIPLCTTTMRFTAVSTHVIQNLQNPHKLPRPLLSLNLLHFIIFLFISFRIRIYYIYPHTQVSPQNSLYLLRKLHGFLSFLSSPLLFLIFILDLLVPSLISLLNKHFKLSYIFLFLFWFYITIYHTYSFILSPQSSFSLSFK